MRGSSLLVSHPGVCFSLALASGVMLEKTLGATSWIAAAGTILALLGLFGRRGGIRLGSFLLLGVARSFGLDQPEPTANRPAVPAPRPVVVWGTVVSPGVEREGRDGAGSRTVFSLELLDGTDVRVVCEGPTSRRLYGGETIRAQGTMYPPRPRANPGDRGGRRRLLVVRHPQNLTEHPTPSLSFRGRVSRMRGHLLEVVEQLYPQPLRGLLAALLLGERRLLTPTVRDAFEESGTLHLLAISGFHVGILMFYVLRVPLPSRARTPFRLGFLAIFTLLTGGSAPAARAALMFSLHLSLLALGRCPTALNSFGWTAVVLVLDDPSRLQSVGFQLSFCGVFFLLTWGQTLGQPRTDGSSVEVDLRREVAAALRRGQKDGQLARLREELGLALRAGLAAWAGTMPLILYHFYRVHPLAPLWTVVSTPLVAVLLVVGGLSLLLGLLTPALGAPLALLVEGTGRILLPLLEGFGQIPLSTVHCPPPPLWAVPLVYGCLVGALVPGARRWIIAAAAVLLVGTLTSGGLDRREPTLWHFAVGSGDAALLAVPGAGTFVVDAGAPGQQAGRILLRNILATGERRLDGAFLTHPHADHARALPYVAARLFLPRVWVSSHFRASTSGQRVLAASLAEPARVTELSAGDRLTFAGDPGLSVEVLHPPGSHGLSRKDSPNDMSLALRIQCGGSHLLLLGDLEERGLAHLFATRSCLRADVLLIPHHGRRNGLIHELLARVRPEYVLISGSGRGGANDLLKRLEAQGIRVLATWIGGAIRTTWQEGQGWVPTYWGANGLDDQRPARADPNDR